MPESATHAGSFSCLPRRRRAHRPVVYGRFAVSLLCFSSLVRQSPVPGGLPIRMPPKESHPAPEGLSPGLLTRTPIQPTHRSAGGRNSAPSRVIDGQCPFDPVPPAVIVCHSAAADPLPDARPGVGTRTTCYACGTSADSGGLGVMPRGPFLCSWFVLHNPWQALVGVSWHRYNELVRCRLSTR